MSDSIEEYIELQVPYCSKTFGEGDCVGHLSTFYIDNGPGFECYNCASSCLSFDVDGGEDAYDGNTTTNFRTHRFTINGLGRTLEALPILKSIKIDPSRIFPGEKLPSSEKLTFSLTNISQVDYWQDNYITTDKRVEFAFQTGQFLNKFNVWYPNVKGFPVRHIKIITENGQTTTSTRYFTAEQSSFDGKTLTINCLDELYKLTEPQGDEKNLVFPPVVPNTEYAVDTDKAEDTALPFNIVLPGSLDLSEINAYYSQFEGDIVDSEGEVIQARSPNEGLLLIGQEIVRYLRTDRTFQVVERGLKETKVGTLKSGSTLSPVALIKDTAGGTFHRFCVYSGISTDYLDSDFWAANFAESNPIRHGFFAKSEKVKDIINSLIKDCALDVSIDLENRQINVSPMRRNPPAFELDQSQYESHSVKNDSSRRVDTAYTYYGLEAILEKSKVESYSVRTLFFDNDRKRQAINPAFKLYEQYNQWHLQDQGANVESQVRNYISRYNRVIRIVDIALPKRLAPPLGSCGNFSAPDIQDVYGRMVPIYCKVVSFEDLGQKAKLVLEEFEIDNPQTILEFDIWKLATQGDDIDPRRVGLNLFNIYAAVNGEATVPTGPIRFWNSRPYNIMNPPESAWVSNPALLSQEFALVAGDWPEEWTVDILIDEMLIVGSAGVAKQSGTGVGGIGGGGIKTTIALTLNNCEVKSGGGSGGTISYIGNSPYGTGSVLLRGGNGAGGFLQTSGDGGIANSPAPGTCFINGTPTYPPYFTPAAGGAFATAGNTAYPQVAYVAPPAPQPGGSFRAAIDGISLITQTGTNIIVGPTIN